MPIIKSIITGTTGSEPVLVEFENGKVHPGEETNLESSIYEQKNGTKLVGLTTNSMLYTSILKEDELYNNYILIHNKKKNKLQMVQVDYCIAAPQLGKPRNNIQGTPLLSRENNVSELRKEFGSKKSKRVIEQKERLTMNIETVKEQLEKTVTDLYNYFCFLNGNSKEIKLTDIGSNRIMSIIMENIDYNSPSLTWKIPSKKVVDLKTIGLIPLEPGTVTIELSNATDHSLPDMSEIRCQIPNQVTHVHQMPQHTQCFEQQPESIVMVNSAPTAPKTTMKKIKTVRKKFKKLPVDGMVYHSQQLGLKVPPKKSLGIRGMVIHSQAREVINNVFKFMKEEAQHGIKIPLSNYRERVLSATGISKCTYSRITTKEFKLGEPQPCRRKKNIKLDESTSEQITENDSIYRPKINRDASTRDGIYNLEDLVPGYILDTLAPEAGHILTTSNMQEYNFGPFVSSSINNILMNDASEEIQIRRITIFMYINYLIKFMTTPMKNITKKYVACDKSPDVNSHILDNFSVNSQHTRTRPLHLKDKAICYTLVLAAIAMEYEVNVEQLSKDLKIGVKKTLEVSRILAFNASKDKHIVQLNLPLPAPVTFSSKRKRV